MRSLFNTPVSYKKRSRFVTRAKTANIRMSENSEILFQLVVKKDGDKYTASTLSGSYSVTSSSPIDAVMNWGFRVRDGIKKYRNGEITFEYFRQRLGVSEAEAKSILDSQEIIELSDERLKLDHLLKNESA
ncbi:hypothetical protein B7486_49275 [cyanobacterium TDX16]|nr:hypothetical protein B7486_49275 [cyanobacterium TDX16]